MTFEALWETKQKQSCIFSWLYWGTRFLIKSEYLEKANKQTQACNTSTWELRQDGRFKVTHSWIQGQPRLLVSLSQDKQKQTNKPTSEKWALKDPSLVQGGPYLGTWKPLNNQLSQPQNQISREGPEKWWQFEVPSVTDAISVPSCSRGPAKQLSSRVYGQRGSTVHEGLRGSRWILHSHCYGKLKTVFSSSQNISKHKNKQTERKVPRLTGHM